MSKFIPYVIDGGLSLPAAKPTIRSKQAMQAMPCDCLVDLFLQQLRAQMRALVATETVTMTHLLLLVTDEIENLAKEVDRD